MIEFLSAFYRHGYVVLRNTPTVEGTLRRITDRLGYIVGNNFGWIFDVRAEPNPTDLAYTSIELLAHTDQPYRRPVPGHPVAALPAQRGAGRRLDAGRRTGGGERAARRAPRPARRAGRDRGRVRATTWAPTRSSTVATSSSTTGTVATARSASTPNSTTPVLRPGLDLDAFYAGRRWLTEWLNDPAHQVTFRLEPGDVMFMDNHRALHGRTAFDSSQGSPPPAGRATSSTTDPTRCIGSPFDVGVPACRHDRTGDHPTRPRRRTTDRGGVVHGDGRRHRRRLRLARSLRTCPRRRARRPGDRDARTVDRLAGRLPDHAPRALAAVGHPGAARPAPTSNWVVAALVHDIGDELAPFNHSEYAAADPAALRAGRGALGGAAPRCVPELLLRPPSRRRS